MAATLYTRYRGETIIIAVVDSGAQPGGEALVASGLRAIPKGRAGPHAWMPDAASMMVSFRAPDGIFPAGWLLTLNAASCAALRAGNYLIDLRVTDDRGTVTITNPAIVMLAEPATL